MPAGHDCASTVDNDPVHRIDTAERRRRLVTRHLLTPTNRTADPVDAANAVVALHATDPATVYLSAWARMSGGTQTDIADAMYLDKRLTRLMAMRRTMFVVDTELAPVLQASSALAVGQTQRKKLVGDLTKSGAVPGDVASWLDDVCSTTLAGLRRRGRAAATDLVQDEPRLNTVLNPVPVKSYETPQKITSRVLTVLALEGHIVRGQPFGGWTATRNEWWPAEQWMPGGLGGLDVRQARTELVRRWLAAFGPAPVSDLLWWTGWTGGQLKTALEEVAGTEVELDSGPGLVLADDLARTPEPEPAAVLLPALDPTPMGWLDRDFFLGPHRGPLFDRTGNIGPTLLWGGRVVGGWAQRADGEIATRLLEDVGADGAAAIAARAADLEDWLGPLRVVPRFRTPLERELSG